MATAALVRGADAKSRAPLRARGPAAFAVAFAATGGGTTATADLASVVPAADGAGPVAGVGRVRQGSQHGPGCGFRGNGGREDCRFRFEGFDVGRHDGG